MRLLAAAVILLASQAWATSITPTIEVSGTITEGTTVSCATTSTPLYNNPKDGTKSDLRSLTVKSLDPTHQVYLCALLTCTTGTAYAMLDATTPAYSKDKAVRDMPFSCIAVGAAVSVIIDPERG